MTEEIFRFRKVNIDKLLRFGFAYVADGYLYDTDIVNGTMKMTVQIDKDERVFTQVIDNDSGDEYVLHRVSGAAGAFVGQVRTEYEEVLEKISAGCFDTEIFKGEQAKAVIAYVRATYGDELEYLWEKFPDNAIVRRKDNQKWYAALLTVSYRKLGLASDEAVEILDLRIRPEDLPHTVDHTKYFPGYHMNKKHWITLCLNGSVTMEEIYSRIDDSYSLAQK